MARALRADPGSLLVFLPGAAEIRRTESLLRERVTDPSVDIVALYGALDADVQDRAIAPAPAGRRKVVLATSIAETSLTIEGVRVVIDCGLARVPRYEPDVGLTRLETVRVSRASADQRRGRAGRTEPGVCYRLWDEPQTASLDAANTPEILAADLTGFMLDLAHWGVSDPAALAFLDPPPAAAVKEAKALLASLGAIDGDGRITEQGRRLRQLPLPPRLARMVADAPGAGGARCSRPRSRSCSPNAGSAATTSTSTIGSTRSTATARAARRTRVPWRSAGRRCAQRREGSAKGSGRRCRRRARCWRSPIRTGSRRTGARAARSCSPMAAARTSIRRRALAREPFLAVAEIAGTAAQGRILLAAPISLAEIEAEFADRIESREDIVFDDASASLRGRRSLRLGAIALSEQPTRIAPNDDTARMLALGVARLGLNRLPWSKSLLQWRDRAQFLRGAEGDEWPDLSDAALAATAADWLAPALAGKTALGDFSADELTEALTICCPGTCGGASTTEAPTHFVAPTGSAIPIDYAADEGPKISVRVQELFGLDRHPAIAGGRVPLVVELLSPAHRPVQVTRDLPGFWRGSYAAVKAEMKGRYPRHPWPDNPLEAPPTRRAKPRGE